jgi:cytochrome c biogenesis protein CcdA
MDITLPSLTTILISAAIDSINPCAIGVMILLISTVIVGRKKKNLLRLGAIYIAGVYVTYFLAGLGLIAFLQVIPIYISEYISIIVAAVIMLGALSEIKDYFWYGKGFTLSIAPERAKDIERYAENLTVPGLVFLGAFVAGVELPCTGGPYLAITFLLSQNFDLNAFILLVIYNIIFVMPLVVLLLLGWFGMKVTDMKKWKQENRAYMRLGIGLLLIALAWLLMLIANGTISFI